MSPADAMARALALARRGRSGVGSNPMVGCVILSRGRVVAAGFHRRFGGPHAEEIALKRAGSKASGSTVYVTLEPCCDFKGKKTPPCARALIDAGVAKVVAATRDPNPRVGGRGLRFLRRAGIRVQVGLLGAQAEALNRPFFARMRLRRPYVVLKTALSLDGRAAGVTGRSRWITGPAARRLARRLRAESDAVLVGVGTVLRDDPRLTSRGGREPVRVVLDSRLRTPARARVLQGPSPTWIFTASAGKRRGADMIRVPLRGKHLDLRAVLRELADRGVGRLMVEGGPTVHAAFLAAGAVDEARVFLSPKLLSGSRDPGRAPVIASPRLERIAGDFLVSGTVKA